MTPRAVRVLLIEDVVEDAELLTRDLRQSGLAAETLRVDTEPALRAALTEFRPDLVLSDYSLPGFDGIRALEIVRTCAPDVPFIFVSATIGEERAIEALHRGAVDYVMKDNRARLVPAITRALSAATERTTRIRQHERITRLSRIHAVSSGINAMIVRVADRRQMFRDACRIAVEHGGFRMVWIAAIDPETLEGTPVAWSGIGKASIAHVRITGRPDLPHSNRPASRALRDRRTVVVNDISREPTMWAVHADAEVHGYRSVAALPLMSEGRVEAVIALFAGERGSFDDQEVELLERVAEDLSFALDYHAQREKLVFVSSHDALTGLLNRETYFPRLAQLIDAMRAVQRPLGVAVVDLQHFRLINDTLGRESGDEVLKAFARRLTDELGHAGMIARSGGDRFALAFGGLDSDAIGQLLDERIVQVMNEPLAIGGEEVRVTCKIGVAMFPDDGASAETLFHDAEAALQRAKQSFDACTFYSAEMNARVAERLQLEERLRTALRERQFHLHYQPKIELRSRRIVGLEALIRWNDPVRGSVAPFEFVPVLEQTGLIVEAGRWVIEQALADMQRWRRDGHDLPRVAVNVSCVQVMHRDFVPTVYAALATQPEDCWQIDLEVTESVVLEKVEANAAKLAELRAHGLRIFMDDFGTGYSSLSQIASLPLDGLKIDRTFIARMGGSSEAMAIVSTIVNLAKALRIKVVAEGVETDEQAARLAALGCDEAQGFLFGRPQSADDISRLLSHRRTLRLVAPSFSD